MNITKNLKKIFTSYLFSRRYLKQSAIKKIWKRCNLRSSVVFIVTLNFQFTVNLIIFITLRLLTIWIDNAYCQYIVDMNNIPQLEGISHTLHAAKVKLINSESLERISCTSNQLTGFYIRATLALTGLIPTYKSFLISLFTESIFSSISYLFWSFKPF